MPDNIQDKRQLANQELSNTVGSGVLSMVPTQSENFVELPKSDGVETPGSGNVVNNYNMNVTVNGAVEKALPTMTAMPDAVKKNSSEVFQNLTNDNGPVQLEQIRDLYADGNSSPMLQLAGLDQPDDPELSYYSYTTSPLKESSDKIAREYQILQNVIRNSVSNQTITNTSPYSYIDTSFSVQQTMNGRQIQNIENLNIENNTTNNLEVANEMSRRQNRIERHEQEEVSRSVKQLNQTRVPEEIAKADDLEASVVIPKEGAGSIGRSTSHKHREMQHLNPTSSTIEMFMDKMNSPPIWRTVQG
jgi:hypothetical protein